jgi:hypothetical protein
LGYRNNAVRNKLEKKVQDILIERTGQALYESEQLEYIKPASSHTYTPDWKLREGVYLETKGIWDYDDRMKMLLIQEQHPDVVVAMCFYNSDYKIRKGSKTSYADWCDEHLIPWMDIRLHQIPDEWLHDLTPSEVSNAQ